MKLITCVFILMVSLSIASAQSDVWQKFHSESGLEFYIKKSECHDIQNGLHDEYWLIQVQNTTSYPATVQWNYHLYSDENCINCKENNVDIKQYQVIIPAGETVTGSCDNIGESGLHVFSRFLNYRTQNPVTKVEINQLIINFN